MFYCWRSGNIFRVFFYPVGNFETGESKMKIEIVQCCASCQHSFISVNSECWRLRKMVDIEDYYWCDKWELHEDLEDEVEEINP